MFWDILWHFGTSTVYCLLSTIYCLLSNFYYLRFSVYCLLSTVYCLCVLVSVYFLQSSENMKIKRIEPRSQGVSKICSSRSSRYMSNFERLHRAKKQHVLVGILCCRSWAVAGQTVCKYYMLKVTVLPIHLAVTSICLFYHRNFINFVSVLQFNLIYKYRLWITSNGS